VSAPLSRRDFIIAARCGAQLSPLIRRRALPWLVTETSNATPCRGGNASARSNAAEG